MRLISMVTILILIDGFLQLKKYNTNLIGVTCHNPYFNRWFSAIQLREILKACLHCHNPYFNRWFSAI